MLHYGISRPLKGGYGVYIKGLSDLSLGFFVKHGVIPQSLSQESLVTTQSERLAWKKTPIAAKAWIDKHMALPLEEQIGKFAAKAIWPHNPKQVAIRVQYYRLIVRGRTITTSPRIPELEKLGKLYGDYLIQKTVSRTHVIGEDEYNKIKHELLVLPALPKSKREIKSFKKDFNSKEFAQSFKQRRLTLIVK